MSIKRFLRYTFIFCQLLHSKAVSVNNQTGKTIPVIIQEGQSEITKNVIPGSSVQQILSSAELSLGTLDRTEPPSYSIINNPVIIKIIRVSEEYSIKDVEIPYEHQIIQNESLSLGEKG